MIEFSVQTAGCGVVTAGVGRTSKFIILVEREGIFKIFYYFC
jgi:hypothetical protein